MTFKNSTLKRSSCHSSFLSDNPRHPFIPLTCLATSHLTLSNPSPATGSPQTSSHSLHFLAHHSQKQSLRHTLFLSDHLHFPFISLTCFATSHLTLPNLSPAIASPQTSFHFFHFLKHYPPIVHNFTSHLISFLTLPHTSLSEAIIMSHRSSATSYPSLSSLRLVLQFTIALPNPPLCTVSPCI